MTSDDLRNAIEDYRRQAFGGGMIPFDAARRQALADGSSPVSADAAGVYAVLNAFAFYVELKQAGYTGLVSLKTGEPVDDV